MTSDFLFTDSFISTANKNFDTVIFENTFDKESNDFLGAVSYHTRQEKKLLIVVSKTPVDTIFPLIQNGKAKTFIINPSCWLPWFANKGFWDMRDISKARDFGLDVIEPIYYEQVLDFLDNQTNSCYIRINEHTPWKNQLPEIKSQWHFVSFQNQWYSWSNWTILCFWSTLIDSLYGAGHLQEDWNAMDLFASYTPFFTLTEDIKESLKRTEKLVIIIDQHLWSLYDIWLMWTLLDSELKNISITFITPYYKQVSSLALEYMYEQADMDWFSIKERINK